MIVGNLAIDAMKLGRCVGHFEAILRQAAVARAWTKKLGKFKEEIAAVIAKVGDNAETVKRELDAAEALKK